MSRAPAGAGIAFLEAAIATESDDCIEWPYRTFRGYGHVTLDDQPMGAHRAALIMASGPPPGPGMCALHEPVNCHNPSCVNPKHLRWGTQAENVAVDRVLDGTDWRGEKHPRSKLTVEEVYAIREDPRGHTEIAKDYCVGDTAIGKIKRRQKWAWLPERPSSRVQQKGRHRG